MRNELRKVLRDKVDERHWGELAAISREPNEEMFFSSLMQFGLRLKEASRDEAAVAVLGLLSESSIPGNIRERAGRERDAVIGRGSTAMRWEFWLGRLGNEGVPLKMILPAIGASVLGQAVQAATWGRWLAMSFGRVWSAGALAARLGGSLTGFAVELSSLTLAHRALRVGPEEGWGDTLRHAAVLFGSIRVFQGFSPSLLGWTRLRPEAMNSLSLFAGMMTAAQVEARMGPPGMGEDATRATDLFASMMSTAFGLHLAARMMGPNLARLRAEWALRAQARARPQSNDPRPWEAAPSVAASAPASLKISNRRGGDLMVSMKRLGDESGDALPLDRRMASDVSSLSEEVRQLPVANPSRLRLFERLEQIRQGGYVVGKENEFLGKLGEVEVELGSAWRQSVERRLQSVGGLVRHLAETGGNSALRSQVEDFFAGLEKPWSDDGGVKINQSFELLFLKTLGQATRQEWERHSPKEVPPGLLQSVETVVNHVLLLDLLQAPLSSAEVEDFLGELVGFYRDYPPASPFRPLSLSVKDVKPDRIFLLRDDLQAGAYLHSIAHNLRGYRRLFGEGAGFLFHEQALLISRLRDGDGKLSAYFLAIQKGQHEFINGLRIALFDKDPRHLHPNAYLAKVGLNFNGNALKIVNVQGAAKFRFSETPGRPKGYRDLETFLGGANPLDMLTATTILLARHAGFARVDGIRDCAQLMRENRYQKRVDRGFYDLLFRKFGFQPPLDGEDYWSLNLQNLEIRRKRGENSAELSPGEYFREVLIRRNRDERGKNIRPEIWDRQESAPLAPPVVAFWKSLVPALSAAAYQLEVPAQDPLPLLPASRPFELVDLKPKNLTLSR
jgi:hypothetical protein